MALASIVQDQFGGGIFRGRRAPADSVYDAINALLNDERELYRRGGSKYKSNANAGATLLGLRELQLPVGQRTIFWSSGAFYVLDGDDATPVNITSTVPAPLVRPATLAGAAFLPTSLGVELVYGGSRKTSNYSTGTVTITAGSTNVTGAGTSWLSGADAGMILKKQVGNLFGVVRQVTSNTALTLASPAPESYSGTYVLVPWFQNSSLSPSTSDPTTAYYTVAGQRLIRVFDNRAYFSRRQADAGFWHVAPSGPTIVAPLENELTDFHEIPRSQTVVGADALGGALLVFTTGGVWVVSNLELDLLDDVGNVQHQVSQVSQDLVLWSDSGLAAYQGALVVPAVDDVYAFSLDGPPVALSQGIRPLYREYVEAGYRCGLASVYRGQYWLPILDGSNNVVDVLTCRLDLADLSGARRPCWTRQANGAAGRAYATRIGATARTPKLLGLDGLRVSDLTGCFDPDATRKDDADGTDHQLTVDSNDFQTGSGGRANMVRSALVTAELVDAASDNPTYQFFTSAGPEGSTYTQAADMSTGSGNMPETDGTTLTQILVVGPNGAGGRKVDRIRWRFRTTGAAASAVLRRVELKIRVAGRQ
jgi:hypothetical protein